MNMFVNLCLTFVLLSAYAMAQENKEVAFTPKEGDVYITPLPIVAVNPTFGVLYGVAASVSGYAGNPKTTRMSTSLGTLTYSTKNQLLFTYKSNVYLEADAWVFLGDWRYFDTSQSTYGLGTGTFEEKFANLNYKPSEEEQNIGFKYVRFHETAFKAIFPNAYVGIGYHYDKHYHIKEKLNPPTSHEQYSYTYGFSQDNYTSAGLSLNLMYDSRDNAANPYKGRYFLTTYRYNSELMGSDRDASTLWLEYRDYFNLSGEEVPEHLLAIWTYGWFETSGKIPYMDLPAEGWDQFGRSGRAYTQGRFRGNDVIYAEVEYRARIWKWLGGVVFANTTTASSNEADIKLFDSNDYAYGTGLRFMIDERARTNINLDIAWGKYGESAFYLNLNETF